MNGRQRTVIPERSPSRSMGPYSIWDSHMPRSSQTNTRQTWRRKPSREWPALTHLQRKSTKSGTSWISFVVFLRCLDNLWALSLNQTNSKFTRLILFKTWSNINGKSLPVLSIDSELVFIFATSSSSSSMSMTHFWRTHQQIWALQIGLQEDQRTLYTTCTPSSCVSYTPYSTTEPKLTNKA